MTKFCNCLRMIFYLVLPYRIKHFNGNLYTIFPQTFVVFYPDELISSSPCNSSYRTSTHWSITKPVLRIKLFSFVRHPLQISADYRLLWMKIFVVSVSSLGLR